MNQKDEVITFKVDGALAEQLRLMPNRSEFIRQAVLQALQFECPVCRGTGTLSPNQMKHWEEFSHHHHFTTCDVCGEHHISCDDHNDSVPPERHPPGSAADEATLR
jgi:RecJ-like exonuclease